MTTLKIRNKKNFIQNFLTPISKVNELCSLTLDKESIYNLNRTAEGNFILFAYTDSVSYDGEKRSLSFADIKKFIKAFECIPQEENVELKINHNNIEFTSHVNRFKFHLIDDNIVRGPNYTIEKINSLEFDTQFKFSYNSYLELLKSSTFLSTEKVYISTKENHVFAELTDKTKNNVDSFGLVISDSFVGDELDTPLCFDLNLFRSISFSKNGEALIKINSKGIIEFGIEQDNYKLKYITTAHIS
jgi:hypothetical protein